MRFPCHSAAHAACPKLPLECSVPGVRVVQVQGPAEPKVGHLQGEQGGQGMGVR